MNNRAISLAITTLFHPHRDRSSGGEEIRQLLKIDSTHEQMGHNSFCAIVMSDNQIDYNECLINLYQFATFLNDSDEFE
jgi:hypothetical protein